MSFSELEKAAIEKTATSFCTRRNKHYPPDQLYIDYRLEEQSLHLFEVRPRWDKPSEKMELPTAKFSYVRSKNLWNLYWQKRDLKWHLYEGLSSSAELEELLTEVWNDPYGCFWT